MKKYVLLTVTFLAAFAAAYSALPAAAWDAEKRVDLGLDRIGMRWHILDYGTKEDGTPFAVARKFYTNEQERQKIIELLMSKFGYSEEVSGSLNSTEYEYEYTEDGKLFAVTYLRHQDMLGNEIHGTVYDDSSAETKKVFSPVVADQAVGKAAALAVP